MRCAWCTDDADYRNYHDTEWGVAKYEDTELFEMLILENAQAGLSWLTILKKRNNYQLAFDQFNVNKIATYTEADEQRLLADAGIIRDQSKIRSAIKNARVFIAIQKEFGSFSKYLWVYVDHKPKINYFANHNDVPVSTEISEQLSKDLKRRGMSFVGPVIMYAYMQSVGMVNDHTTGCFLRQKNNAI